jgi:hypothetical protein
VKGASPDATGVRTSRATGSTVCSPQTSVAFLETDDGASILFSWQAYTRKAPDGRRHLVGGMTHLSGDERYSWLNDAYCAVVGEVQSRPDDGFEVVMDVLEVVWEPLPGASGG